MRYEPCSLLQQSEYFLADAYDAKCMQSPLNFVRQLAARFDRGWWQPVPAARLAPFLVYVDTERPFHQLPVELDDPALVQSFRYYNNAPQQAYVYHIRQRTLLEPVYGYGVWGMRGIVPESMPYWYHVGYPSFAAYVLHRKLRSVQREHAVISLHEFGDDNYYHFYGDVLGKLALLEEHGVGADLPVVVSARLANKPYFRAAIARSAQFRARRWIVQDQQYIDADEVIVCKTLPHRKRTFDALLDLLQVPPADPQINNRIFLTRNVRRGRFISNAADVARVCGEYGFEAIDADRLSLDEQIACFGRARYVVGIHGAGLTNTIFRRGAPLSLLELFPPDNLPPHYWWLAQNYGFGYDALVGHASAVTGAFTVDTDLLRAKLHRLLHENPALQRQPDRAHVVR